MPLLVLDQRYKIYSDQNIIADHFDVFSFSIKVWKNRETFFPVTFNLYPRLCICSLWLMMAVVTDTIAMLPAKLFVGAVPSSRCQERFHRDAGPC